MSDPVTNIEIEDVLSSIRRLVSEESRKSPDEKPKLNENVMRTGASQGAADKLVLTQALRVPEPSLAKANAFIAPSAATAPRLPNDVARAKPKPDRPKAPLTSLANDDQSDRPGTMMPGAPIASTVPEPEKTGQTEQKDSGATPQDVFGSTDLPEDSIKFRVPISVSSPLREKYTQDAEASQEDSTGPENDAPSASNVAGAEPWHDPNATLYAAAADAENVVEEAADIATDDDIVFNSDLAAVDHSLAADEAADEGQDNAPTPMIAEASAPLSGDLAAEDAVAEVTVTEVDGTEGTLAEGSVTEDAVTGGGVTEDVAADAIAAEGSETSDMARDIAVADVVSEEEPAVPEAEQGDTSSVEQPDEVRAEEVALEVVDDALSPVGDDTETSQVGPDIDVSPEPVEDEPKRLDPVISVETSEQPEAEPGHRGDAIDKLTSKIAALETRIGRGDEVYDPDEPGTSAYAGVPVEAVDWKDGPTPSDGADLDGEEIEADEARREAEEANADIFSTDEMVLDEDTLRELVTDIVREELQGALGERITRNVRKLVRREIHRALAASELD